MPTITRKAYIKAEPGRVFDVISDVEGFSRYSKHIKEVREGPQGRYNWRVEFFGMTFRWKAELVRSERPVYFEWRSTEGLYNAGSYRLEEKDGHTLVTFKMEFRMPLRIFEAFSAPIMSEMMSRVSSEILDNVQRELE
jgi:uncharacterized membrane protein